MEIKMGKNKNKKKKKKPTYIDDGSTVADMSGIRGGITPRSKDGLRPRATFKEQFHTYTDAVKMMFLPMLAVLGIIAIAFLIVYIIL